MPREFPEQFKCPVCLDIPEREIFQCQNGHTTCDICVQSLSTCPQCRVNLGSKRIRNRQLEELLDMMTFDCSYKQKGCGTKVRRKNIKSHSENCLFGGEQIHLCKFLGYACSHVVNTKRLQDSMSHLQQQHQCLRSNENVIDIKLKQIENIDRSRRCLFKPIIIKAFHNYYVVVICSVESNVSFICLAFGEEPNDRVEMKFRIVAQKDQVPILEWTTKPTSQAESEVVLESPPFQFPLNLLMKNYNKQEGLTIHLHITDHNILNANHRTAFFTLDSFSILQPYASYMQPLPKVAKPFLIPDRAPTLPADTANGHHVNWSSDTSLLETQAIPLPSTNLSRSPANQSPAPSLSSVNMSLSSSTTSPFGGNPTTKSSDSILFGGNQVIRPATTLSFGSNLATRPRATTLFGSNTTTNSSDTFSFGRNPTTNSSAATLLSGNKTTSSSATSFFGSNPTTQSQATNLSGSNKTTISSDSFSFKRNPTSSSGTFSFTRNPTTSSPAWSFFGGNMITSSSGNFSFGRNPNTTSSATSLFGGNPENGS